MNEQNRQERKRHEDELASVEAEMARLTAAYETAIGPLRARAESERMIVQGYQGLERLEDDVPTPPGSRVQESSRPGMGARPTATPKQPANDHAARMGTAELIILLLTQHKRPMTPAELTRSMLATGWGSAYADPNATVQTAIKRLATAGRVRRTGHGLYAIS